MAAGIGAHDALTGAWAPAVTDARTARRARLAGTAGALAAAMLIAGIAAGDDRAWAGWLIASFGVLTVGLAGLTFMAIQYVTGAQWAVALRRIPEAMTAAIPVGGIAVLALVLIRPGPYPWTHELHGHGGSLAFKAVWLSWPFLLARGIASVAVWTAFARALVSNSRRQDADGDAAYTRRNIRLSVATLIVLALSLSLASFDWIMSLEPEWYSTIFGVYQFAGLFSSGLALIVLLAVWLRRGPLAGVVSDEHLHDLGKLLFAFCTFWMYIWFSQYMLIWYANLPEETSYFAVRTRGIWEPLFLLNMLLNWAIPFAVLLGRSPKRRPEILSKAALVVLAGRCLDLYLMVAPPIAARTPSAPPLGTWELVSLVSLAGATAWIIWRSLSGAPLVPTRDPGLARSLHYHS
ncbi:MAG: hypothetical protein AB1806_12430 [Acidobacteriota bacterium]